MNEGVYVIDSNCFNDLGAYFPSRFPSFWERWDDAVSDGDIASVSEALKEMNNWNPPEHIQDWIHDNGHFFVAPTPGELQKVAEIFRVPNFLNMVGNRQLMKGSPVADPFLVAAAWEFSGCVVTAELHKPHSAKIPTVCKHFGVECCSFEQMMEELDWEF